MLRKQLNFLRKRGDVRDGQSSDRDTPSLPNPPNTTMVQSIREPRSGASSQYSNTNSIDHQFTGSPDIVSQGVQGKNMLEEDPLGLKVIYRPLEDRNADIIFVHGLGGSSRKTWSKNRNLDVFWPLKFLPLEPDIKEARILTFGYNANFRPGSGRRKMSILDFAKDLLYDLKYAKDESVPELEELEIGKRPIIFIVHSMGGLVVKEAYIQGQNDPIYENIIKAVSSIIFLATPHRGTNLAEILNRILQVTFAATPMQFISELVTGSQTLQRLNEQFRHAAPKLHIVSFYETRPTVMRMKTQVMILEKDSSVLGYPGEISKPLDADHHGVCKYESLDDPRYIAVRNVLKSLVGKVKTEEKVPIDVSQPSKFDLEGYLSVSESPDADYNFFRDRWTYGTCDWILSHEAFTAWIGDNHLKPRFLWINGNAASGKSVLTAFVIDHLFKIGRPCHYFFMRFADQKKRELGMMLRSLAYQLAKSMPAYANKLRQLEAAGTNFKSADYRNIWQCLYKQSLFQLENSTTFYLVIDGVDEADSPGSIIKLLSEMHQFTIPLRVLIVSRNTHEISSSFQKLRKQIHMDTIRTEGNLEDFRSYIDQEMDVASDELYREEVITQLLEQARGNFLWLHLIVQKINNCHIKEDVEKALRDLPPGMEAIYNRMSFSVASKATAGARALGRNILGWVTCAQRLLSVEELSDALGDHGVLAIHRMIGDLCGGFVTVDHGGIVSMIHETARDYLTRRSGHDYPLIIDRRATNDMLLRRCITCLIDPTLRSQVSRNQPPALLDYATNAWFVHLSSASYANSHILDIVVKFLQQPHVLTWIYIAVKNKELRALVAASRHLTDVVLKLRTLADDESMTHRQAVQVFEGWATDFVKIVGKFGNTLRQYPDSIYKLIPPFCPEDSIIYQRFGLKERRTLSVSGPTRNTWDDCLARFSLDKGAMASTILAAGSRIAVLTNIRKMSQIVVYNSGTFEEQRRITHLERVFSIQVNKLGNLLVSYGYTTTKVWNMATGDCLKIVNNPSKHLRPHTMLFVDEHNTILVGTEDRRVRTLSLNDESAEWETKIHIDDQRLKDTIVNFPMCSAFSPDGNMIAFGYRGHPVTAWELDPPMMLGQCNFVLDATDMTIQDSTWGEVFRLAWHPFNGEVLGLTQVGLLFKWHPYEEAPNATAQTGADYLTISSEGSLVATGDGIGNIKIYSTTGLSLLYQLSSEDPVLHLSFSTDSRQLYDIRGHYGNVWEPNTLIRLADECEYVDGNSDFLGETESITKPSLNIEHHFSRVDSVISLSGQSVAPLYCYGTEGGVAVLCEVGRGKVCELERLSRYMSIEQVVWSEDGRLVALIDLSRRLRIKKVTKYGDHQDTWTVKHEFSLVLPPDNGYISQVLFHPASNKLAIMSSTTLFSINVDSQELRETILPESMPKVKWICHPTVPDYLLAFGNTQLRIFSWASLREVDVHTYFPPRSYAPPTANAVSGRFQRDSKALGRLISNVGSSHILLEVSHFTTSDQIKNEFLIFDVANFQLGSSPLGTNHDGKDLPYTVLPQDIASRIREPLAFLSHRRLVFLDVERWVCTWQLPESLSKLRVMELNKTGIRQFYFLPVDWATADEVHLCTIMPDGTLLCPRNGDVAVVQCTQLRM